MKILSIASSSSGNCYSISDGSSTLLVECGIPLKQIMKNADLLHVDACLITHEHQDHSKAAKDIVKYMPIYASFGTIKKLNVPLEQFYKLKTLQHNKSEIINSFLVIPFDTQHDAEEPLGFLIYSMVTKERVLFATDTYYIKCQFRNLDYIMVECNYSEDLLSDDLTKTERLRLLQSHFEFGNVKKFLSATDLSKCKRIYLLHLSDRNSDEKRFQKEIEALTGIPVEVCGK